MSLFNIENDCLYKNFKKKYECELSYKDMLNRSGFLDEKRNEIDNAAIYDYNLLSLPILEIPDSDKLAVIVTTGSFSPLHEGHIESMNIAKKYIEKLGYKVIQGVISLSHDSYVNHKNGGIAKLNVSNRTQIVYEKIKDIDWLTVDRFEGEMVSIPINFSTVLERIKLYFNHHTCKEVKIFYVFGSDNADFSYAFVNNKDYFSICVERNNYEYKNVKEDLKEFNNIYFLKNNSVYSSYSSTEVRKTKKSLSEVKLENSPKKLIYFIRTDDVSLKFANDLKLIIEKYLNKKVEVRLFNSENFKYNLNNCISMDKYIKGDHCLDVSRIFQLSGYQNKAKEMCSLKEDINIQMSRIPKGIYKLIDDDSVSGYTMKHVSEMLSKYDIVIKEKDCLISLLLKNNEELYDVIDARDFLLGANNGGLVVSFFGKSNIRVPYIFPLVNLTTRANILPDSQIQFTKELLDINLKYNCKHKTSILKYLCYNDNNVFIKKYLIYINNYLGV